MLEKAFDMKINRENLLWVVGFFEANSCFTVSINKLFYSKNRPVVYIRPMITILKVDENYLTHVLDFFGLHYSVNRIKVKEKKYPRIQIKHLEDLKRILFYIQPEAFHEFMKRRQYLAFRRAVAWSIKHKQIYYEWEDEIREILEIKDEINRGKNSFKRYSVKEWEKEIKKWLKHGN